MAESNEALERVLARWPRVWQSEQGWIWKSRKHWDLWCETEPYSEQAQVALEDGLLSRKSWQDAASRLGEETNEQARLGDVRLGHVGGADECVSGVRAAGPVGASRLGGGEGGECRAGLENCSAPQCPCPHDTAKPATTSVAGSEEAQTTLSGHSRTWWNSHLDQLFAIAIPGEDIPFAAIHAVPGVPDEEAISWARKQVGSLQPAPAPVAGLPPRRDEIPQERATELCVQYDGRDGFTGWELAAIYEKRLESALAAREIPGEEAMRKIRRVCFEICESTEENISPDSDFNRGRCYEAKSIRNAIGDALRGESLRSLLNTERGG